MNFTVYEGGLVCLGSALVVLAAAHVAAGTSIAPVIQGVVTGIGFLGAGVIMRHESDQNIQGLTTAAYTWLTACIGIACAVAPPFMAIVGLLLAYVLLALGGKFEKAGHGYFYPKKPNTTDKP